MVNLDTVKAHSQMHFEYFLAGEFMSLPLAEKVYDGIDVTCEKRYMAVVKYVKDILKSANIETLGNVVYINTEDTLSETEKAVMIRVYNLPHKASKIIVHNDVIVFIPPAYQQSYTPVELAKHVSECSEMIKLTRKLNQVFNFITLKGFLEKRTTH